MKKSPQLRLYLKIADLKILITADEEYSHKFLLDKYSDYITDMDGKTEFSLYIKNGVNSLKTKGGNFYIYNTLSIKTDFSNFNDVFRLIFIKYLHKKGGFAFHASSIIYKDEAYIFTGKEGSGKSTIRKMLSKYMSLGDDMAIIKDSKKGFFLCGSPFI